MPKYLKVILAVCTIAIFSLLISPFVSLLLPEKLTNRTYYRLLYHVIADKETAGSRSEEEKALRLFQYVVDHEFLQGTPYSCKPAESLLYGEAWCDFQSRTLNALLGVIGIPCRYAMLLDKEGNSPHTLNEIFLRKKWAVFDPSMNTIFEDDKGNRLSLQEMSDNPLLAQNNKKLVALKEYDRSEYNRISGFYSVVFPMRLAPRRSTPTLYQTHILDYMLDIYFKLFKYGFSNFYQDLYLKVKKGNLEKDDFRLFYLGRSYHLFYRKDAALKLYNTLLEKYPASDYAQDAIFFCGLLYFDTKNFSGAARYFKLILEKYPGKWKNAAYYCLGRTYELMNDKENSLRAYRNADIYKLSAQTLEELNKQGRI